MKEEDLSGRAMLSRSRLQMGRVNEGDEEADITSKHAE